jgi:hypothetical protein
MQPTIDKDKMPPDAETDTAPQNSDTATSNEDLRDLTEVVQSVGVHFLLSVIKPLVFYTLIHIALVQQVSMLLSRQFLVPILFMFLLRYHAKIKLEHTKLAYEKSIVANHLSFDKAIESRDANMEDLLERSQALKDLAEKSIDSLYEFRKSSEEHLEAFLQSEAYRKEGILVFRKETNKMRLGYLQLYFAFYEALIESIEHIVKRVKDMTTQPKVKGTKGNSNHRNNNNDLTATLEHMAAELKQRLITTKKKIAVAEKIEAVLEREGLLPQEIDRLVEEAEGDLQQPQDASLLQPPPGSPAPGTGVSPSSLGKDMDAKLEKHYEELDKWFRNMRGRPIVEE